MQKYSNMKTHQLLGYTQQEYESLVFELFFTWSELYGKGSDSRTQFLLTNKPVSKWFVVEYKKLLKEFKKRLKPYLKEGEVSIVDRQKLWIDTTTRIYEIYPKILITEIKIHPTHDNN